MRISTFKLIFFTNGSALGARHCEETELRLASSLGEFQVQFRERVTRMCPPAIVTDGNSQSHTICGALSGESPRLRPEYRSFLGNTAKLQQRESLSQASGL